MKSEITNENKAHYLSTGGVSCPFCRSDNIEAGNMECDSHGAYQGCLCEDCGREWTDVYALTDVGAADLDTVSV